MAIQDFHALTQQVYIAYFGRPADPSGRDAFAARLSEAGVPATITGLAATYATSPELKALIDGFAASPESSALYGADTTGEFVQAIFRNVLGREAKAGGLSFWSAEIDSGRVSRAGAAVKIMAGAFANTTDPAQAALDQALINKRTEVALKFTAAVDQPGEVLNYRGADAAAVGRGLLHAVGADAEPALYGPVIDAMLARMESLYLDWPRFHRLSSGVDRISGHAQQDVVDAYYDSAAGRHTLSAGDVIDLAEGSNTLHVFDPVGGTVDFSKVTVRNLTGLHVTSIGSLVDQRADLSGLTSDYNTSFTVRGPAHTFMIGGATAKLVNPLSGVTVVGGYSLEVHAGTGTDGAVVAVDNSQLRVARIHGGSTVTIADGSADSSKLSSVELDGNSGAAVLTGDAIGYVRVANTDQNVTVHNRLAGHTMHFNVDGAGGILSDATGAWLDLAARGAASAVTLRTPAARSVSIDTAVQLDVLLEADAAHTLRVALGSGTLTIDAASKLSGLTLVNASLFSGKLTFEGKLDGQLDYLGSQETDAVSFGSAVRSVATGDGADRVRLSDGAVQVDLGSGDDSVVLGNRNVVSGGQGKDSFDLSGAVAGGRTGYATIADPGAGDSIRFKDGGAYLSRLPAKVSSSFGFDDALNTAASGTTPGRLAWFTFEGNTYVVNDRSENLAFVDGADQVVKLTGLHDLSSATVDANGVLTII